MEDYNEEEGEQKEIFTSPRLFAEFCREVSLGADTHVTGSVEYLLDGIFLEIGSKVKKLMQMNPEEIEDEDMCVRVNFVDANEDAKRIALDRVVDLGFKVYERVDTAEEEEYINELSNKAELENDQLMKDILDEAFYKNNDFLIYW